MVYKFEVFVAMLNRPDTRNNKEGTEGIKNNFKTSKNDVDDIVKTNTYGNIFKAKARSIIIPAILGFLRINIILTIPNSIETGIKYIHNI